MSLARKIVGGVFLLCGVLLVVWGVVIAAGDPYDIGRVGLVILGGAFVLTGLIVAGLAVLFLKGRPLVGVHAIVALGLVLVAFAGLSQIGWLVAAIAFGAALAVLAHAFALRARPWRTPSSAP